MQAEGRPIRFRESHHSLIRLRAAPLRDKHCQASG